MHLIKLPSMITTVTGKNQITIPAALARELDIAPGTRLDWEKGGEGILIVKIIPNRDTVFIGIREGHTLPGWPSAARTVKRVSPHYA